jgi:hypothetical protein
MQLLELEGHHGKLSIGDGHLRMIDGSLVGASFLGLDGRDAAVEALVRARGRFVVDDEAEEWGGAAVGVQYLILESCRVLDDLERFGTMAPPPGLSIGGLLSPLLSLADGERTFASLIASTGVPVVHALPPIVEAVEQGHLRGQPTRAVSDLELLWVRASAPAAPVPEVAKPKGSFDDLVFAARKHVRARQYDDAARSLRAALEQRPDSRIAQQNLRRVLELGEADS